MRWILAQSRSDSSASNLVLIFSMVNLSGLAFAMAALAVSTLIRSEGRTGDCHSGSEDSRYGPHPVSCQ